MDRSGPLGFEEVSWKLREKGSTGPTSKGYAEPGARLVSVGFLLKWKY